MSKLVMKDCSHLFGTQKVNATWTKEMADDIAKIKGFDYGAFDKWNERNLSRKEKIKDVLG